jgi:hypothetical protein
MNFGAEFAADPPCQPALTGHAGRENDGELGRNFEIFRQDAGAAIGYVDDRAVARQRANAEMQLGAPVIGAPLTFSSIRKECESHNRPPFGSRSRFSKNLLEFA